MPSFQPFPFLLGAALLVACETGGPDRESRKKSVTRLKSSDLAALAKSTPGSDPALTCDGLPCLTPLNLEGRIYSGNLMVGGNGGPPGVPVRIVEGYDPDSHGPSTGRGGSLHFSLVDASDLGDGYACCGSYPSDDLAVVHRLEFLFDYLDCTLKVPASAGSAIAGKTYTLRMVYVDTGSVDDLPQGRGKVTKGDKLLRREGEETFHFCTESGCIAASRPDSPLQAGWKDESLHMAYPHYTTVGISLKTPMPFPRAEAEKGGWRFTVDWDLGGAAVFDVADWSQVRTEAELVEAFDLLGGHGGPGNIGVKVDMTKSPMAESLPNP